MTLTRNSHGETIMSSETSSEHWLILYDVLRKRLRRIALTLAVLAALAAADGFAYYDYLEHLYTERARLFSELSGKPEFRAAARTAYLRRTAENRLLTLLPSVPVSPSDIEGLKDAIPPDLTEKIPLRSRKVLGFEVNWAVYTMVLVGGPTVLMLLLLAATFQIRQLHARLRHLANDDGEVQQKLNSLFYERVTRRYGEGWKFHVIVSGTAILIFALAAPMVYYSTQAGIFYDQTVFIDASGTIKNDPTTIPLTFDLTRLRIVYIPLVASFVIWGAFISYLLVRGGQAGHLKSAS